MVMVTRLYFNTEPIKNFLEGNRERFTAIIASSFETMEQKVEDVLKSQCEQRYGWLLLGAFIPDPFDSWLVSMMARG